MQKKERRMEKIEQEKRQLINFGHKFNKLGGTKVIIAYFGLLVIFFWFDCREAAFFLGIYGAFKAGLVTPDAIVALMNKHEFTARFSHLIANNPNVLVFVLFEGRQAF